MNESSVPLPPRPRAPTPFGPGTISIRLYGHGLTAAESLEAILAQARRAAAVGFDGVTVSEHHGGFAGYLPNPLQLVGWILEENGALWAAPGPMLLTLRPAGLVAEEVAWLATRFPGRVGLGVAAGSLQQDFDIAGVAGSDLAARFEAQLVLVARALRGEADGPLGADPAIAAAAAAPVTVASAAMSRTAARRAARTGVGLMLDSLSSRKRLRQVRDWYVDDGGGGPVVVTRWVWVGDARGDRVVADRALYRSYTPPGRQRQWADGFDVLDGPADAVAARAVELAEEVGATVVNLRVHAAGAAPEEVAEQIDVLGHEVLPQVRAAWAGCVR